MCEACSRSLTHADDVHQDGDSALHPNWGIAYPYSNTFQPDRRHHAPAHDANNNCFSRRSIAAAPSAY